MDAGIPMSDEAYRLKRRKKMESTRIEDILTSADELNDELEYLKRLQTQLPIEVEVIHDTTYLPGAAEFKQFYAELNTYGISLIEVGNGTVKITSGARKTIVIGIRAIAEIVADKLNMPIHIDTDQQIPFAGKPNFIENVDALLKNKMEWVKAEFKSLFEYNDPRIEKLCHDYHKVHSIPIIALIEYLKWERELINLRMQAATIQIEDEKSKEIRQIRNEYKTKLDGDKSKLEKRAEVAENNYSQLKQAYDRDWRLYASAKEEINQQKGTIEDLHKKNSDTTAKNKQIEEELRLTKTELEKLREKAKKTEGDEWSTDFTNTDNNPAFCNNSTDEIITFPCAMAEFKTNYKLQPERTEEGERVFKEHEGTKEIKIPESLAKAIPELIKEQQGTEKDEKNGKAKPKISLSANDQKVMEAITESEESLTPDEIATTTGIKTQNLYSRHIPKLIKQGCIEETHKGNEKAYQAKEE